MNRCLPILVLCLLGSAARASGPLLAGGAIVPAPPGQDQGAPPLAAGLAAPCGPEGTPCPPGTLGRRLLVGAAGTGLLVSSGLLGVAAGTLPLRWHFQATGRNDPLVTTGAFGLGLAVGVSAAQLLVPLAAPLGDDEAYAVSVADARLAGWERSRWAVLAGGVGLVTMAVGAGLERREFGAGQAVLTAGGVTVLLSGLVYLGLELAGVMEGSQRARRPRG